MLYSQLFIWNAAISIVYIDSLEFINQILPDTYLE